MYRLLLLALLFASCKNLVKSPQSNTADLDSLIVTIRKQVNHHFHNQEPKAAGRILDSLKPIVDSIDYFKLTGAWLRFKTVEKTMEGNTDSGRYYGEKALSLAKEMDSTQKDVLAAKTQLADVYKQQNLNDSALVYAREAYYLAKTLDTTALPLICLRLSEIYSKIKDQPLRRQYLFEGLHYSTQPTYQTVFANNISSYYGEMGLYDSAIIFFKAMEKDTTFSSPYFNAVKYENLGINLTNQKRYQEGLFYQLKAAAINKEIGEMDGLSYFNLAATYRHLGEYQKAIQYLDTALQVAAPTNDWNLIKRIWHARATNLTLQKNYKAANLALDSAYSYFETEVDSSIIVKARELETQYKVKAKDDEIKTLAYSNEASRRINQQQRLTLLAVIVAGVLLAIVGILLWRRGKLKATVTEFELRQQLLRARMEPHFILNSLGTLLSFIRAGLTEKAIYSLTQFSRLMSVSLENAEFNYVSLKDEIDALESYLQLQEMNYEGLFEYKIEVYEGYKDQTISIPPMLLQPFVENAILHGFRSIAQKGMITVHVQRKHQTLQVTIEDNGVGLQSSFKNPSKRSFATAITQERLDILFRRFKKPATLTITDKQTAKNGQGLKVELVIPFHQSVA